MRITRLRSIVLLTALAVSPVWADNDDFRELQDNPATSANDWRPLKIDRIRNIRTYSKLEDGKSIRSFRVLARLNAPMEKVAWLHFDADNIKRWFWETTDSRLLKKVSSTEIYYYQVFHSPLGIPDRDVVVHLTMEPYTTRKGYLLIRMEAAPTYLPPKPGMVRILAQNMVFKLKPLERGDGTDLEMEGYIDPGGGVPGWAINYVQRSAPYVSFVGLQRMLQTTGDDWKTSGFTFVQ